MIEEESQPVQAEAGATAGGRPTPVWFPGAVRYKLTVAYDGTDFCGWQRQADDTMAARALATADGPMVMDPESPGGGRELRTVQAVLERAVREVVREPISLMGASRTDSGVHARGQVAAFTSGLTGEPGVGGRGWPAERGTEPLVRAINSRLPDDMLVLRAEQASPMFDPIGDCTSKGYSYTLWLSHDRPLWERRWVHHIWSDLDISAMRAAAAELVGERDFAAFAAAGHGRKTTVRTVHQCTVEEAADGPTMPGLPMSVTRYGEAAARRIVIRVSGGGFLWHMVRIIAGTLMEVGRGKIGVEQVREALTTGDRRKAGPTLPACGLCLEWIRYGNEQAKS